MSHDPKICLDCARRRLAGKPTKACADCALLNVDRLASVRANAAKPSPAARYASLTFSASSLVGGLSSKPARSAWGATSGRHG